MKKLIFFFLLFLLVGSTLYFFVLKKGKIYINPIKLAQFSRIVPVKTDPCLQTDQIEYYYYEDRVKEPKNNKFGLYIYPDNEQFIKLADELVNSNGGNWGYVLLPYNIQDKDKGKWERVFYLLNEKHLIPIVQLWNIDTSNFEKQTKDSAKFLDQFVWPIKQRYISAYNEPNDAKFWYGKVDPAKYAEILNYTIDTFKKVNEDFFILNGALNVSAATTSTSLDAFEYLRQMNESVPDIFAKLDGWASHSYPQPNFSGSPYDSGRWSIKAYEEELNYLRDMFGVQDLPVFITETGWAHDVGKEFNNNFLPINTVSEYYMLAFKNVWLLDERVVAVTPFTIWYESPVDHFAFVDNRWKPYPHFQAIKDMDKISGNPQKLSSAQVSTLGCD